MDKSNPFNRRTMLRQVGTTGILFGAGSGIVRARPNSDRFAGLLLGTHADPISVESIRDLQKDKLRKMARTRDVDSLVLPSPETEPGEHIVAYAQRMTRDGIPRTYTGYAYSENYYRRKLDNEDFEVGCVEKESKSDGGYKIRAGSELSAEVLATVSKTKKREIERVDFSESVSERHKEAKGILDGSTPDVSTLSDDDYSADPAWDLRNWDTYSSGEEPYGYLDNDVAIWWHDQEDVVASTNTLNYTPGVSQGYAGDYELEGLDVKHHWSANSVSGDVTSIDRYPSGDHTGRLSINGVTIGYLVAGISFDYYQPPTTRTDNFDQSRASPQWNWQWNSERDVPNITRVGSISRFDDPPIEASTVITIESAILFRSLFCPPQDPCIWVYQGDDNIHSHWLVKD